MELLTNDKIAEILQSTYGPLSDDEDWAADDVEEGDRAIAQAQHRTTAWGIVDWLRGTNWGSFVAMVLSEELIKAGHERPEEG